MSETSGSSNPVTPKHLWVVGSAALLWYAIGAFDFVVTQMEAEWYLKSFTPEQREFFHFPWLVDFAWALAVWGGVIGALLLLLRKRPAVRTFGSSLVAVILTTIHNFGFSNGLEVMGGAVLAFTVVKIAVALALLLYARAMTARGVLT
jgi:hypothetical protein